MVAEAYGVYIYSFSLHAAFLDLINCVMKLLKLIVLTFTLKIMLRFQRKLIILNNIIVYLY